MHNNRVLIIGPEFYDYNKSINCAFKQLGYDTEVISYLENLITIIDIVKHHYLPKIGVCNFQRKYREDIKKSIKETYDSFNPDLVFVIKGSILDADTLNYFDKAKKILWMMDSIGNVNGIFSTIDCYDFRFMFEKSDVCLLKEKNIDSYFLPLALDRNVYNPLNVNDKKIDIVFVGALYDGRKIFFEKIAHEFKQYNIKIYGKYLSIRKPSTYFKYYLMGFNKSFTNKNISPINVNEIYNSSKIAINVHHRQSRYGCNPRFFEILGSKTFQIVDNKEFILDNFDINRDLVTFTDFKDLKEKIEYYLAEDNERDEIAKNGYEKVKSIHTFKNRILNVLKVVNLNAKT